MKTLIFIFFLWISSASAEDSWWKALFFSVPESSTPTTDKLCPGDLHFFDGSCIKIPDNAKASEDHPGWDCLAGYIQKRSKCIKLYIPENATLLEDGKTWVCNQGYFRYRSLCRKE